MEWLEAHQAQLFSLALVVFGAIVTRLMRLRPRLQFSIGHAWDMLVDAPLKNDADEHVAKTQVVRTASITVKNAGLQAAKNVEIAFNWKPPVYNIWPARSFKEETSTFNRFSLKVDSLAPSEALTIEIMAFNSLLPAIMAVRSEESVGKEVGMALQRTYPSWVNALALLLLTLGAASALYLTSVLIQGLASSKKAVSISAVTSTGRQGDR